MTKSCVVLALALLTGVACIPCLAQTTETGGLTTEDFAASTETVQPLTYDASVTDPLATGYDQLNATSAVDTSAGFAATSGQGQPGAPRLPHAFRGFIFAGTGSGYGVVTLVLGGPQGSGGGMLELDGQPLRLVQASVTTQVSTSAATTGNVVLASISAQVVALQTPTTAVDATGTATATAQVVGTLQGTVYLRGGAPAAAAQPGMTQPRGPRPNVVFEGVLQGTSFGGSILALGEGGPGPRGRGQNRGQGQQGMPQNFQPGF